MHFANFTGNDNMLCAPGTFKCDIYLQFNYGRAASATPCHLRFQGTWRDGGHAGRTVVEHMRHSRLARQEWRAENLDSGAPPQRSAYIPPEPLTPNVGAPA
jgi:hypothetical protein